MRVMSLLVLLAYFIASLIPDLLAVLLVIASGKHMIPYEYRDLVSYLFQAPWVPFLFAITFSAVTFFTAEEHRRPTKEDVFAFVLIITLIFIIIQYGGVFVAPFLAAAKVNFYLFAKTMAALFIALVAWKGLHIPLGGIGVFIVTLVAIGMALTNVAQVAMPISFDAYWFTIIGTLLGIFAAFSRS